MNFLPAGSGRSGAAPAGRSWWERFMFADSFHPTPYGHALMADQVGALHEAGVDAAFLNSSQSYEQAQEVEWRLQSGQIRRRASLRAGPTWTPPARS